MPSGWVVKVIWITEGIGLGFRCFFFLGLAIVFLLLGWSSRWFGQRMFAVNCPYRLVLFAQARSDRIPLTVERK
jgi:hypothetical protein